VLKWYIKQPNQQFGERFHAPVWSPAIGTCVFCSGPVRPRFYSHHCFEASFRRSKRYTYNWPSSQQKTENYWQTPTMINFFHQILFSWNWKFSFIELRGNLLIQYLLFTVSFYGENKLQRNTHSHEVITLVPRDNTRLPLCSPALGGALAYRTCIYNPFHREQAAFCPYVYHLRAINHACTLCANLKRRAWASRRTFYTI
jgi:hypothetical protein